MLLMVRSAPVSCSLLCVKLRLSSPAPLRTGFGNALLLSGDTKFMDAWRTNLDSVNANCKTIDGVEMSPHMHGDDGWCGRPFSGRLAQRSSLCSRWSPHTRYDYAPEPYSHGSMEVFDWSNLQDADRSRVGDHPWLSFLEGNNPDFPIAAMQEDFVELRSKLEDMRNDPTTPDTVRIEHPPFDPSPPSLTRRRFGSGSPTTRIPSTPALTTSRRWLL